jgi:pyridoxal phosphate enzyme (YggS family)
MSIRSNIDILREKISKAASESAIDASEIIVVCVVKNRNIKDICEVLDSGISYIGENKVQEAQERYPAIAKYVKDKNMNLSYHMVGHLQTNKVNKALEIFDLIHSVDDLKLAQRINESSRLTNRITDVLVEVNTSREDSKFGINSEEAVDFIKKVCEWGNIRVRGLMTMAPLVKDKEETRPYFRKLRQLKEKINNMMDETSFKDKIRMDFLSMGMSQDYEIAVQEGSNMLRIGTAIFEGR